MVRIQVITWACSWHLKRSALACGIWFYLWVDSFRIELNCRTPISCLEHHLVVWGNPPPNMHWKFGPGNTLRELLWAFSMLIYVVHVCLAKFLDHKPFLLSTLNHIQMCKCKSLVNIGLNKNWSKNHDELLECVWAHTAEQRWKQVLRLCSYCLPASFLHHPFQLTSTWKWLSY